jgi:hypothetical protein
MVSATNMREKPTVEVKQTDDDSQQDKCQIKMVLHEPISPYTTISFNGVTSFAQGVSLAALFYVISTQREFDLAIVGRIAVLFLIIAWYWYFYLSTNQFCAWRPRARDTVSPMLIAVAEWLLILSIRQPTFVFSFCATLLAGVSIIAGLDACTGNQTPSSVQLFKEHYRDQCEGFAEDFRLEILRLYKSLTLATIGLTVFFSLITVLLYVTYPANELAKSYLLTALAGLLFVTLFRFDFRYYVNHSKKLQRYGFEW